MSRSGRPIDQLVVVGSSAGGVDALGVLLADLPADLPAAVVVAQHLDTTRTSRLGEVLSARSRLPIVTVETRETLKPGTVYVVPANRHVEITDQHVNVHADAARRPTPSVDLLFETAAAAFGERLIAVILTGSGSDGALGAHTVKEAGGAVLVQDPETAAFPSMPRAPDPPLVDASAPLERLGAMIAGMLAESARDVGAAEPDLTPLLDRLRERRGIDFSSYKAPTIRRRLRRRMIASGVDSISAYLKYLETHPEEEQRLVADFLIKVTRFFRDPPLFDTLRTSILPDLVATATAEGRDLRLWSAGCATGEEAYSLAVLLAGFLSDRPDASRVRIFATDLDESALSFARRGVYPASALNGVPDELIARYFVERDGAFEAAKQIRNMIVFGSHDLGQRPPFPHMDLILCRNVLIYFTPDLQRRALDIFAYSLRDGGFLVLGKSETPRPLEQSFAPVDRRLRIYRRHGPRRFLLPSRLPPTVDVFSPRVETAPRTQASLEFALRQASEANRESRLVSGRAEDVIRRLPMGVAVVSRNYDIELINGAARELLGIHGAAIGQDIVHLAQRVPSAPFRNAIERAARGESVAVFNAIVEAESETRNPQTLTIQCFPDRLDPEGEIETLLLVVSDITPAVRDRRQHETTIAALREEVDSLRANADRLALSNRRLLAANRELTDSVDQLREQSDDLRIATAASQVAAEEIETLNEELQSSNEELETLHEEAQATVEELNVANEELQARSSELEHLAAAHSREQARLAAILAGMGDAVLVVDRTGKIVLTNTAYDHLVGALVAPFEPANEQGTPLSSMEEPIHRLANGEAFSIDFTAVGRDDGRYWFEATGRPLFGDEGGGVLVIRDITDRSVRRLQDEFLSWAGHELRTPLTALQSYLQMAIRRLEPNADERVRAYLAAASDQARRQTALVEELLDATRLRSGRFTFAKGPLDLVRVVERAVEIAQMLAHGQTIHINVEQAPVIVDGNAGRLEQVFLNLLNNAIAYAPGTDRIDVEMSERDGGALVVVRDYGPGIASEELESIFDRFTRGAASGRPEGNGLGLGLFIVREIVKAHDGEISVASKIGEGAAFSVKLPLSASDGSTPNEIEEQ
jgi:two-component system CheB/CheR fusion protein